MRAALYARVSTLDQEPENQLAELRRYAVARGWEISEYVDHGVSGSEDRRKALCRTFDEGVSMWWPVASVAGFGCPPRVGGWTASVEAYGISWHCWMSSTRWAWPSCRSGRASIARRQPDVCSYISWRLWRSSSGRESRSESRPVWREPERTAHGSVGPRLWCQLRGWLRWLTCRRGKQPRSCACRSRRSNDGGGRYDDGGHRVPGDVRGHRLAVLGPRSGVGQKTSRESVALSPPVSGSSLLARERANIQVFPDLPRFGSLIGSSRKAMGSTLLLWVDDTTVGHGFLLIRAERLGFCFLASVIVRPAFGKATRTS